MMNSLVSALSGVGYFGSAFCLMYISLQSGYENNGQLPLTVPLLDWTGFASGYARILNPEVFRLSWYRSGLQ